MTFLIYATAAANLISATLFVRSANKEIAEYTAGTAAVGSDAAIFAVEPPPNVRYPDYLKHASCYYCLDRGNVALESYQGEPGPFWIQFREGVFRARGPFFSYANKGRVDFVLVWDNDRENIPDLVDCREVFRQRRLRVLSHARTVKKQVHH